MHFIVLYWQRGARSQPVYYIRVYNRCFYVIYRSNLMNNLMAKILIFRVYFFFSVATVTYLYDYNQRSGDQIMDGARITVFRDGLTYYEVIWKFFEAFSFFAVLCCFSIRCLHENNITRGLSYHFYWRRRIYLCTPNIRFRDVKENKQQYYPSSIGQQEFDIVNKFKVHSTYVYHMTHNRHV